MRIKRYVAPSVHEALERVRLEMGPNALILQTRRLRRWWAPWQPGRVEVVAAWESPARQEPVRPAPEAPRRLQPEPSADGASQALARSAAGILEAARSTWLDRLLDQDVAPELAWRIVERACVVAGRTGLAFEEALATQLRASVPVLGLWERSQGCRAVMLVGPTGVGKTTTLAKLAANFALLGGWKVGVVTADTFRIGAIEQLRTYAELLGISLEVAQDAGELRRRLQHPREELLLVDTAGHSPRDPGRLQDVVELCEAMPLGSEVLLVLPATLRQADLAEVVDAYRRLPLTGVCLTKLDETRRRGALVNAPYQAGRPLAFVTTGQGVPDDIEVPVPETVVRWLLDGLPAGHASLPRAQAAAWQGGGGWGFEGRSGRGPSAPAAQRGR